MGDFFPLPQMQKGSKNSIVLAMMGKESPFRAQVQCDFY